MNDLLIEATETSPKVHFSLNGNEFYITGNSRPYNPTKFFTPIITWLEEFAATNKSSQPISLKIQLDYFNSSSAKFLLTTLMKFSELQTKNNTPVSVEWHYDEDDFELRETGKEFERLLKIPFNYVAEKE